MDWVRAITFDFWGTLVDVDASGAAGMRKVLANLGLEDLSAEATYDLWDVQTVKVYRASAWKPYLSAATLGLRAVLAERLSVERMGAIDWDAAAHTLVSTMTSEAEPHPETSAVVDFLAARYPLMPITNMDTAYFQMNPFGRRFERVTTAEEARAFKPQERIFRMALDRLGLEPEAVLHVSLSQAHDIEGVKPLGIKCAWINRKGEPLGLLTPRPDYEFPDLVGVRRLLSDR
jgi:2-haloacid dehalogenase